MGTNAHLVDALQGVFDSAPPKLGKLSAEDISSFCGPDAIAPGRTCDERPHLQGETNVRFQPYRLANSKCFGGTDARISCLACHDPHQDVVREDSSYDAKCLSCHAASTQPASAVARAGAPPCPVAKANCVSCHMPKVNLPGAHIKFTDQTIRIVKPEAPLPPTSAAQNL